MENKKRTMLLVSLLLLGGACGVEAGPFKKLFTLLGCTTSNEDAPSSGVVRPKKIPVKNCQLCRQEFKSYEKETITKTPCGHRFHRCCLSDKLKQNCHSCPRCNRCLVRYENDIPGKEPIAILYDGRVLVPGQGPVPSWVQKIGGRWMDTRCDDAYYFNMECMPDPFAEAAIEEKMFDYLSGRSRAARVE